MTTTDIEYTAPEVLDRGVAEGWADPETDPTRIDWPTRQARAAIPFGIVNGRPVNPHAPTGIRYGRNQLGHWGEALAADAAVTATDWHSNIRRLVMVERDDGHGFALPGGHVDPGETAEQAAVRELGEETGLRFLTAPWTFSPPRYVPDPRASDESWMVTVLARVDLGRIRFWEFPELTAGDDAARAVWVDADSYRQLTAYLDRWYGGQVFAAHCGLLAELLS